MKNMNVRPTSITVVAWILIIINVISLITSTISLSNLSNPMVKELLSRNPIPIPVQFVILYVGIFINLISGIAILKGQNWARLLYVIWNFVGFVIGILTSPMKLTLLPGFLFFLVVTFFLFRPAANKYFAGTKSKINVQSN